MHEAVTKFASILYSKASNSTKFFLAILAALRNQNKLTLNNRINRLVATELVIAMEEQAARLG